MYRVGHVAGIITYRALKFIQEAYVHRIIRPRYEVFTTGCLYLVLAKEKS